MYINLQSIYMGSVCILFICHNDNTIQLVKHHLIHPDVYIILVGQHTHPIRHPRIIVACQQKDNIEEETKLLTFTAWYLMVKNKLLDYQYYCLLEYDCVIKDMKWFQEELNKRLRVSKVISFFKVNKHFMLDIDETCLNTYLESKNIYTPYQDNLVWLNTTNHCIRKDLLESFVEWYFPSCLYFKKANYCNYSYYHERLFSVYLLQNSIPSIVLQHPNIIHQYVGSHSIIRWLPVDDFDWEYYLNKYKDVNDICAPDPRIKAIQHFIDHGHREGREYKPPPKKYFLLYDDETGRYDVNLLIDSIRKYSTFDILIFKKSMIDRSFYNKYKNIFTLSRGGGYWLWKPYIIHETLKRLEKGSYLFYMDSLYTFMDSIDNLIGDDLEKKDILVWKNKPNSVVYPMKQWCKMDVMVKYLNPEKHQDMEVCWAGAIALKNTLYSRKMVEYWMGLCCDYHNITDSPSVKPNTADFIESRHDQTLLTIALYKFNVTMEYLDKKYMKDLRGHSN